MDELPGDPGARVVAGSLLDLLDKADRLIPKVEHHLPLLGSWVARFDITSRGVFLALAGLILLLLIPPLTGAGLRRLHRIEPNFRGEKIVQSYGIALLFWTAPMLLLLYYLYPITRTSARLWLITVAGFGLLGLLDDVAGDKKIKGLRGHFSAFFQQKRVTTGLIKAVGGILLACWVGHRLHPGLIGAMLLSAGLIAGSANAINLLDLRPGRAGGIFLLCALPLALLIWPKSAGGAPPLFFIVLPTLIVWEKDSQAKVMMGDVGSNLLGASLGLAIAQNLPILAQTVLLLLIILLHIIAERISITKMIEANPALRTLDRLLGVR